MPYRLRFTVEARDQLRALDSDPKRLKKVRKCLGLIEVDPRHPGLRSHKYSQTREMANDGLWESHVENNMPSEWRVFWVYGPETSVITIVAITPHP